MEMATINLILCIIIIFLMILMANRTESYKILKPRNFPYAGPQVYDIQNMYYIGPEPSYVDSECNYSH